MTDWSPGVVEIDEHGEPTGILCEEAAWAFCDRHWQPADVVVLDQDPVACGPEELADVQVVATMVGGRWVHGGPQPTPAGVTVIEPLLKKPSPPSETTPDTAWTPPA